LAVCFNKEAGFERVRQVLIINGYQINSISRKNHDRHILYECVKNGQKQRFYALFKRTFFHSFPYLFPNFIRQNQEFAGMGESINVDCCNLAITYDAQLLYVYEDCSIYTISPFLVKKFCEKHDLRHIQDKTNDYMLKDNSKELVGVNECQYVFPVRLLERFN
jgi:hypothetical protein